MSNGSKTPEAFVEIPKVFDISENSVSLIGEDAKKLNEEQVAEMLSKISSGDWGSVTEKVRKENDQQLKSEGRQNGVFLGQYKIGDGDEGIIYYVFAKVGDGKTEMLHVTSKRNDIEQHGGDIMESIARMNVDH